MSPVAIESKIPMGPPTRATHLTRRSSLVENSRPTENIRRMTPTLAEQFDGVHVGDCRAGREWAYEHPGLHITQNDGLAHFPRHHAPEKTTGSLP
jgi:hypothetical protein